MRLSLISLLVLTTFGLACSSAPPASEGSASGTGALAGGAIDGGSATDPGDPGNGDIDAGPGPGDPDNGDIDAGPGPDDPGNGAIDGGPGPDDPGNGAIDAGPSSCSACGAPCTLCTAAGCPPVMLYCHSDGSCKPYPPACIPPPPAP